MAFKRGNRVSLQPRTNFDGPEGIDPKLVNNRQLGDIEGNYLNQVTGAHGYHVVIIAGGNRAVYHDTELALART